VILGDAIEGEARDVGRAMAAIGACGARARRAGGGAVRAHLRRRDDGDGAAKGGRGGRNGEFLAGLALGLAGAPGIFALAADTDGIDGSEDNAGAIVTPDTLARAAALGLDVGDALAAQRHLAGVRSARRSRRHRPDAHQRQRLPRDPDRLAPGAAKGSLPAMAPT
jgi:glycerate 2-kinase